MVTASHNPAPDNGYKVYDATGSQIVPPDDAEIAAGIDAAGPAASIPYDPASPRIEPLGREAVEEYLADVLGSVPVPAAARDLKVVYTPLHGVGLGVLRELWERVGLRDPVVVVEQAEPDPDFPTAPFPNPEEPGVLDLALDLARRRRADLVLANDPDADRLAVAVPDGRDWRVLTGDELGVLLGDHVLATTAGDDRVVARSVVSSSMLDRVAAAHGVPARVTLPGFKWVSRAGDADGRRLVFGYEEALGYGVTPVVRDKDGLSAALGVVALAAREHLTDALARLTAAHGVHVSGQWSVRFADADAAAAFVANVRARPPRELAGTPVSGVRDHRDGAAGLPPADLLALELADGGQVLVRPSGTEPKVKCYFEVVRADGDERRARERLDALRRSFAAQFGASGG
ncbi:MAG: hypothetical protein KatS3mg009_2250 [Acidimicrobiia bacterium]|nr:MAG: hypothetical protein KatS3mg009_2250 [Acidimicrobiia bacterium]